MSSKGSSGPPARDLDAARLQPDENETYDWTDSADERDRAIALDRLAGDQDLVGQLRQVDFAGPDWHAAARELARYGLAVVTSWIVKGTIFEKCARKGRPVERPPIDALDRTEAESMAGEVVAVALNHFRDDVLVPGRWDPGRGASLTTYFVGQCILRFPNIYRTWLADLPPVKLDDMDAVNLNRSPSRAVEDDVITASAGADALRLIGNEQARKALMFVVGGYTHGEIADRLGTTEKAVERMVAYAREQVRKGRESA